MIEGLLSLGVEESVVVQKATYLDCHDLPIVPFGDESHTLQRVLLDWTKPVPRRRRLLHEGWLLGSHDQQPENTLRVPDLIFYMALP